MLTDEHALELWSGPGNRPVMGKNKVIAFARAIEQEVLQAPEDFDAWALNPYTLVLQKSIAEGYAPAPCPDCEQVIIERAAAYALADEYKAKVDALTSQTDPRDAYEQIEDFSKGNYRGT